MPIVFEQPSPMSPQTSIDAGRAQVATQDFGALASMYDAANHNQLAASQASASLGLQASEAQARNANQANMHADALAQQRREFAQSQAPSERDAYLAAQAQARDQQHAENQAWLQQQEMSQAEQMQLQRDTNAIGYINQEMEAKRLDRDTGNDLITQIRTRIDPARARVEAQRAKQEEALTQKQIQEATRLETGRQAMDKFWAQNAPNGMVTLPDGSTLVRKANGDPLHIKPDKANEIDHAKLWMDAEKHVEAEEKAAADAEGDKHTPMDPDKKRERVKQIASDAAAFIKSMREAEKLDRQGLEKRYDPTTGQTFTVPKGLPQGQKPGVPVHPEPPPPKVEFAKEEDAALERAKKRLADMQAAHAETIDERKRRVQSMPVGVGRVWEGLKAGTAELGDKLGL